MLLPDCMMPDGANPCAGYKQLSADNARLQAELDALRLLFSEIFGEGADETREAVRDD